MPVVTVVFSPVMVVPIWLTAFGGGNNLEAVAGDILDDAS